MKTNFHFQKSIFKKGCLKNRADENEIFFLFLFFIFPFVSISLISHFLNVDWVKITSLIIQTVNILLGQKLHPRDEPASRDSATNPSDDFNTFI